MFGLVVQRQRPHHVAAALCDGFLRRALNAGHARAFVGVLIPDLELVLIKLVRNFPRLPVVQHGGVAVGGHARRNIAWKLDQHHKGVVGNSRGRVSAVRLGAIGIAAHDKERAVFTPLRATLAGIR